MKSLSKPNLTPRDRRQDLALRGEINIDNVAPRIRNDDWDAVARALAGSGFPQVREAVINYMCSTVFGTHLLPVADPHCKGVTWPTILVPSDDEFTSQTQQEQVLEILREWQSILNHFASTRPCPPWGWVGAICVPHPRFDDEMIVRWPWRHRPYGQAGRSGDPWAFKLFGTSVNFRPGDEVDA